PKARRPGRRLPRRRPISADAPDWRILTGAFMPNESSLPWPEYLRAWLDALRYHPEQHYLGGARRAEAASATEERGSETPARQERAA
ncbi:hypothetical protein MHZ93_05715, partial [Roseomonas sp. ACRSG]|nr:hypothetical protein [Roseomonas sp. ACRSG]